MADFHRIRRRALLVAAAGVAVAAVTLGSAAAAVAAPVGTVVGESSSTKIAGSYIVVLKAEAAGPALSAAARASIPGTARALAQRYGGTVVDVYDAAVTGFSVTLTAAQARRLAAHPAVAYVEQDQVISLAATQTNATWGLDRIDQRNRPLNGTYTYPNTASNVHAYVIDTGIRITHNDFGGRATWGANFAGGQNTDCNGHGTHVAGTIGGTTYGVAKQVRLVAVKVLNCQGNGSVSSVVGGINWVTSNAVKPAVANMSLGGSVSTTIDNAVRNSISSGVTYAIAAGNSNANAANFSPARVTEAITVGATGSNDARASFSNFGSVVDIFAPGVNITSDWRTSNSATNTISGTSMATPHVAGAAALVLSANPSFTPAQVASSLINNATTGVVTNPGSGSPNRLLFVVN
jgi:subtilisin family serine protease